MSFLVCVEFENGGNGDDDNHSHGNDHDCDQINNDDDITY